MFDDLKEIFIRPKPYEKSNPVDLWNNSHISKQMLKAHLDPHIDAASRQAGFIEKSLSWIKREFLEDISASVLDLGCGPGLYAKEFARMGAEVTAIDFSENSVRYARTEAEKLNLNINYINGDYIDYDFKDQKFDLITLIYCDFCVLSRDQRLKLLMKVRDALAEGGTFLFDVHTPIHFDSIEETHSCSYNKSGGFWSPHSHFAFEQIIKYEVEKVILEKSDIIGESERLSICNYLQCFDSETLNGELDQAGLTAAAIYADVCGAPYSPRSGVMAVAARKKGAAF